MTEDAILRACERMLSLRGLEWAASGPPPELLDDARIAGVAIPSGLYYIPTDRRQLLLVTALSRVPTQAIRNLLEAFEQHGIAHGHLVTRFPINLQIPTGDRITVLPWQLVLIRPLDHQMVPAHRRATLADLAELDAMGIGHRRGALLPNLCASDPVAQYLGLVPHDIVRIDRPDGTAYFRRITAR